jgi:hypothetical protein
MLCHTAHRIEIRGYTLPEIEQILRSGFHAAEGDEFDVTGPLRLSLTASVLRRAPLQAPA